MAKLVLLCFKPFGSAENVSEVPSTPSSRVGGQDTKRTVAFVELLKHTNDPLGLALEGGNDRDVKVHVRALRPGGVAEKSGALQVGDHILSINGTATDRLTHNEVNALLENAGNVINLEIEFDAPNGDVDDSTMKKTATIKLPRESPTSYGFTISGGRNENRPITVSNVTVGSSAYRHGILKAGDRILKVNGEDVSHASQMEVHSLLKTVEGTCTLEIEYDVTVHEGLSEATSALLIELLKPKGVSLGLGLSESVVPSAPLWISRIKEAGIADRCGALHVGDRIISIGGVSLENKNIQEVNQMLKKCDLHVQLEIIPGHNYPNEEELLSERTSRLSQTCLSLTGAQSQLSLASSATSTGHMVSHPERMTVTLKADEYGFGLSLQGGATDRINYPLVIASIEDLGPAAKLGQLQVGDEILAINGVRMEGVTLQQAVKLVQEANDVIELEVLYNVNDAIVPTSGIFDVRMQRTSTLTLGITINGSHRQGDTIWISNLKKGGIASRMGMLQSGDVLLAVNGESLESATLRDAAKMLRNAGDVVTLRVSKESVPMARKPETIIFSVELHRNNQSLGITLTGSRDKGGCPTISKIKEDGVAHKTGTLKVGDKILAINSESLFNKTVPEAVRILHAAGDVVTLKISKSTRRRSRPKASSPTGKGRHKDFNAFHREMMSRNRMSGSRTSSINGFNRFNRMPRLSQDSFSGKSTPDSHSFLPGVDRYGGGGGAGSLLSQEVPGEHDDDIMERLTPSEAESGYSRLPPPSTVSQTSHYNRVWNYVNDHQLVLAPGSPPSVSSPGYPPPPPLVGSPTHRHPPAAVAPPIMRPNPYSAPQLLPHQYHHPHTHPHHHQHPLPGGMSMHTPTSTAAEASAMGGGSGSTMSELEEEELAALERRRDANGYRRASLPMSSNVTSSAPGHSPEGKKWDFKYQRSRRLYKPRVGPNGGHDALGRMSPYTSSDVMSRFTSNSPFPNHLDESGMSPTEPVKKVATPTTPTSATPSLGGPPRTRRSSSRSPVKPSSPVSMDPSVPHLYHYGHAHHHAHDHHHHHHHHRQSFENLPANGLGSKVLHVQDSYDEEDDPDNGAKAASGGSRCGSKMSSSVGSRSDYEHDERLPPPSSYHPADKEHGRISGGYNTSLEPDLSSGVSTTTGRSSFRLDLHSMNASQLLPPYEPRQQEEVADGHRLTQSLVLGDKSSEVGRSSLLEDGNVLRSNSSILIGGGGVTASTTTVSTHTHQVPPHSAHSVSTGDRFQTSGSYQAPKLDFAKNDDAGASQELDGDDGGGGSVSVHVGNGLPKQKSNSSLRSNGSSTTLRSKSGSDITRGVIINGSTTSSVAPRGAVTTTSALSTVGGGGGESPSHLAPLSSYSESSIKSVESLNGFKQSINKAINFEQQLKALAESGSSDQDSDTEPHASQGLSLPQHEQQKISDKMKTSVPPQQLTVRLTKPPTTASFGFSVADGQYDQGVYVKAVKPGGPADGSEGLRPYDRILKVNNREISSEVNCKTILPLFKGGDELTLVVARSLTGGAEPFK